MHVITWLEQQNYEMDWQRVHAEAYRHQHEKLSDYAGKKSIRSRDMTFMIYAGEIGDLQKLKNLKNSGMILNGFLISRKAAKYGNLHVIEWLHEQKYDLDPELITRAVYSGKIEILEWAKNHGISVTKSAVGAAISENNLPVLRWLVKNGGKLPYNAIESAARHGDLEMVKFLISECHCKMDDTVIDNAIEGSPPSPLHLQLLHPSPFTPSLLHPSPSPSSRSRSPYPSPPSPSHSTSPSPSPLPSHPSPFTFTYLLPSLTFVSRKFGNFKICA